MAVGRARGLYVLSDKDKLFARVKVDRGVQPTYTDPINPAFNALSIQPEDDGQLDYTHVFSPNVVQQLCRVECCTTGRSSRIRTKALLWGSFPQDLEHERFFPHPAGD